MFIAREIFHSKLCYIGLSAILAEPLDMGKKIINAYEDISVNKIVCSTHKIHSLAKKIKKKFI